MTADIGAFASALDAGEVGREGEYYVWAYREIEALLAPEEFALLREVFSLTPEGNFEAKHMILALNHEVPLSVREQSLFVTARAKLHARRNLRQRPLCDDKVLTGWNGLAISALAQGYQATGEQRYLSAATRAASWIFDTMWSSDGKLKRRYRDGEVRFDGCLEDYAYLIAGLLDLGIASRDYRWFSKARDIQRAQDYLLWSAEKSSYRTSIGADLVAQIEELADGALPSPNAIALSNLMRLSHAWIDLEFSERATALGQRIGQAAEKYPESYCRALVALNYQESSQQVVIVIPKNKHLTPTLCDQIKNAFIPGIDLFVVQEGQAIEPLPILEGKPSLNGEVTAYVCSAQRCEPATNEIEALLRRP